MEVKFLSMSKQEFEENAGPVVYKTYKDGVCTYVGFSAHGFRRIYEVNTNQLGRTKAFNEADTVNVHFYESAEEALKAERSEIARLRPLYNQESGLLSIPKAALKSDSTLWRIKREFVRRRVVTGLNS